MLTPTASTDYPRPATALNVAELLLGLREGNPAAWKEIVCRYCSVVVATIRSFRLQEADTLDAVQMTWLRLAENAHRIQHPERLAGWLATTARRECLHILRQQAKHTPAPAEAVTENVIDPCPGPEQRAIDRETARMVWGLVDELSPLQRTLLRALFTENARPYTEVARIAGIPIGGIGPTRARALHQLRCMLDEHGPDQEPGYDRGPASIPAATLIGPAPDGVSSRHRRGADRRPAHRARARRAGVSVPADEQLSRPVDQDL